MCWWGAQAGGGAWAVLVHTALQPLVMGGGKEPFSHDSPSGASRAPSPGADASSLAHIA